MKNEGLGRWLQECRPRPLSGPVGSVAKNVLARGFKVSEPKIAAGNGHHLHPDLRRVYVPGRCTRFVLTPGGGLGDRPTQHTDLVLQALLAGWFGVSPAQVCFCTLTGERSSPAKTGSASRVSTKIVCSMSRRGNSLRQRSNGELLPAKKRERIKRRIYSNHDEARADVFQRDRDVLLTSGRRHTVPMAACP